MAALWSSSHPWLHTKAPFSAGCVGLCPPHGQPLDPAGGPGTGPCLLLKASFMDVKVRQPRTGPLEASCFHPPATFPPHPLSPGSARPWLQGGTHSPCSSLAGDINHCSSGWAPWSLPPRHLHTLLAGNHAQRLPSVRSFLSAQ